MSFRLLSNAVFHCCLCGREGPTMEFERHYSITVRVLGEPMIKQLYRCRNHDTCELRVRAQADAAAQARQAAMKRGETERAPS